MADNVHITFTSEHEKVLQGLAKTNAKLEKQVGNLKKINREGKGAKRSLDGMVGTLKRFAGPAAIVAGIGRAIQLVNREAKAGAEELRGMEIALKNLVQQAGGDPAQLREFSELTKRISAATGVRQEVAAVGVQKGLALGLSPADIFGVFQTKPFEAAPEELILGVGGQRDIFGKQIADLTSRAIVNAFLEAQTTTQLGAAAISTLALEISGLGRELGGSFAESLGLTGFATTGAATPEIGKTQAAGFLTKLITDPKQRFAGLGILGGIEKFRGLEAAEQRDVIGRRKEALLFASRIKGGPLTEPEQVAVIKKQRELVEFASRVRKEGFEELRRVIANVSGAIAETGTAKGLVTKQIATALADPRIAADVAERRSIERLRLAIEPEATRERNEETIARTIKARQISGGATIFDRFITTTVLGILDALDVSVGRQATFGAGIGGPTARARERESLLGEFPEVLRVEDDGIKTLIEQNRKVLLETRGGFTPNPEAPE